MMKEIQSEITSKMNELQSINVSYSIIKLFDYSQSKNMNFKENFANMTEEWQNNFSMSDNTSFFLNLVYHLYHLIILITQRENHYKFACIFAHQLKSKLIFLVKVKTIIFDPRGRQEEREKEIYYQITEGGDSKKKIYSTLFTDNLDSVITFEYQGRCYDEKTLKQALKVIRHDIELVINSILSRILLLNHLQKQALMSKANRLYITLRHQKEGEIGDRQDNY
jgi:hypothetical protein